MNIAIAGYGKEGQESYRYWSRLGEHGITIVDERELSPHDIPAGTPAITGVGAFDQLNGFDVVVRSAGVAPRKITTDGTIWSATNEFFKQCPAPIIGVTGTKGKGTTSSMIAHILRTAGKTVHLLGNIGVPALAELAKIKKDDVVVYELSSFQLWDLERSPHIAVVLMIEPDHLDVHADFDEYLAAKANIRRYQSVADSCIYHPTNLYSERIAATDIVDTPEGVDSIRFTHRFGIPDEDQVYIQDGFFCVQNRQICPTSALKLPGAHNLENACAAMSAVTELSTATVTDEQYQHALATFEGLPHRLEHVRTLNDVAIYNDSFSSAVGATVAAVKSFTGTPTVVIIGGVDKGADFTELTEVLARHKDAVAVVAIGTIRHKLADMFTQKSIPTIVSDAQTMTEIVDEAMRHTQAGGVMVLSPGCASFDMFKNFYDRGDQFREVVRAL